MLLHPDLKNNFRVGDKVKILSACSGNRKGEIITLSSIPQTGEDPGGDPLWAGNCCCPHKWELIPPDWDN